MRPSRRLGGRSFAAAGHVPRRAKALLPPPTLIEPKESRYSRSPKRVKRKLGGCAAVGPRLLFTAAAPLVRMAGARPIRRPRCRGCHHGPLAEEGREGRGRQSRDAQPP